MLLQLCLQLLKHILQTTSPAALHCSYQPSRFVRVVPHKHLFQVLVHSIKSSLNPGNATTQFRIFYFPGYCLKMWRLKYTERKFYPSRRVRSTPAECLFVSLCPSVCTHKISREERLNGFSWNVVWTSCHWRLLQTRTFQFPTVVNTNATDAQTCEVGRWCSAMTSLPMILYAPDDVISPTVKN
jgi:hypothetical protein